MLNLFYATLFHINYGDLITINVKFSIVSLQNHINSLKKVFYRLFFNKAIDNFISMRKFETINLHTLIQGLRFKDFECFYSKQFRSSNKENFNRLKNERIPLSEQSKVNEIVQEWIYWLFEDLLIPLLKVCHFFK